MPALVAGIHVLLSGARRQRKTWMAGTSPAMTWRGDAKRPDPPSASVRLDSRELDHLGPLLCFISDELAEVRRRAREWDSPKVRKPCLHVGVRKSDVNLPVEFLDYVGGCVFR